ncbi:ribosome maturation factor RimM [Campylobacter sp. LR291e]|uniref:ribosome maturation factor RimM n=1 Tax=unclassified Campylobacter TaxID=2593542 RepID=UPI003989B690
MILIIESRLKPLNELLKVAKLGKTIGLNGHLRLHNLSDFLSQFKKGATFFCNDKTLTIKAFNKDNLTILFEGFEDINLAKNLVNKELYQSIEKTRKECKLKKDEFFYFDILKCEVYDSKQRLGKVVDILENTSSCLFEINTDETLIKQGLAKNFYIPYIDKYVLSVDIKNFKINCSDEAIYILENS